MDHVDRRGIIHLKSPSQAADTALQNAPGNALVAFGPATVSAAGLHGNDAARKFADKIQNAVTTKPAAQNNGAGFVKIDRAANRLVQINPKPKIHISPPLPETILNDRCLREERAIP